MVSQVFVNPNTVAVEFPVREERGSGRYVNQVPGNSRILHSKQTEAANKFSYAELCDHIASREFRYLPEVQPDLFRSAREIACNQKPPTPGRHRLLCSAYAQVEVAKLGQVKVLIDF